MSKNDVPPGVLAAAPYLEFDEKPYGATSRPPQKYTPAVRDVIVEKIRKGVRPEQAAVLAGISINTFHRWMKQGREGHVHLWEFADAVERALAELEENGIAAIAGEDGKFTDKAENAKWFLERRFAAGYSKDVAQKFNAALEDLFGRLESSLPPDIFQMVLAAASGQAVAMNAKPTFKLLAEDNADAGSEEEDSADPSEST